MGIGEGLKSFYFACEDKWYAFWDKVDSKIPVYGAIEKIDKVIPSFVLFIIIAVLLIAFFSWGLFAGFFIQSSFVVSVIDIEENPLPNASVEIRLNGQNIFSGFTNELGETEKVPIPIGSTISLTIAKEGFEEEQKSILVQNANQKTEIILKLIAEEKEINILLKDQYNQPVKDAVTVSFACKNPGATAPSSMTVTNGQLTVLEPANCGGLLVTIDSAKYKKISSREVKPGTQPIFLSAIEDELPDNGSGKLRVQLKYGNATIEDTVTVQLYKDNGASGIGPIDTKDSAAGIVEFTKAPGDYFVKTASGKYAQAVSETTTIEAGKTSAIVLALEQNIAGRIKLQIKDEASKQIVKDASILLKKENTDLESKKSDENGAVEFSVMEDASYGIIVDAENYCLKVLSGIRISATTQTVELKKFTGECGATLKVEVLDQDGKSVKDAIAGLYNEEGYSTGFPNRITDINGIAQFPRVPSGTYKAFALKGSFSGWSDSQLFQQRLAEQTKLTVTMVIPDGTIRINAVDSDGNPMVGANVLFMNAITLEKIGGGARPIEDANGTIAFTTRADKKIYFIITKSGYADYTSSVYQVIPSTVQETTAVLEKEIISGDIKIKLLGLYKGDEIASVLAPGETYTARLQLKIPKNSDYKKIGLHIRAGNSTRTELDGIMIKEINVFGRPSIIKATSFTPNNNYEEDVKNTTSENAKWINAEWTEFQTGIINVEATVKVKETAKPSDELVFWYRTWAVDNQGRYLRDKEDKQLGTAENTQQKQALYAEAYSEYYNVGTETLCDEEFCFSASILDIEAGLSETATSYYKAKLFGDYALNFTILNKSLAGFYYEAEIRVLNEDEGLLFSQYSISGAQNQEFEGNANSSEINWTTAGDFTPGTTTKGNIDFTTKAPRNSIIKFQLRSAQRIIFEKTIDIQVNAVKELAATIVPELLPSGIENKITATVTDNETGREVENALVKIEDKYRDVLSTARTNSKGIAILTLPSQQPSEKLLLIAEKPDYKQFEKEITVDDKIALLKPDKIGITLNAKTLQETEAEFTIENKSSFELIVTGLSLKGKFLGIIDEGKAKNWLDTFLGEKITAKTTKAFSIKAGLTELGKQIKQTKTIDAVLTATVSAMGGSWQYEVPVTIAIGLGGEVDDPNCFKITKREWKGFTEGQPIDIEFEVQNNCAVAGNPVALSGIEAEVKWQGSETGTFSVTTEQAQVELVSGYAKRIFGRLETEQKSNVTLTFTPNPTLGAEAKADIIFKASNPTETGTQELVDRLNAQITITNLLNCIGFDKEIITIKPNGTGSFTIETIGCGGETEIRLESLLGLSKKKFTLPDKGKEQIEITTEGAIPGQYIVSVFAKGSGETEEKFIKNLRVKIQSEGCIEVSKFEFDVFKYPDNPYSGYDTATITNHCYDKLENIEVTWSEKNLDEAQKEGMKFATIMGLTNLMGQGGSPVKIFDAAVGGTSSDWCLMGDNTVLYKQNGRYINASGQPVAEPAQGMCAPWTCIDTYAPDGKTKSTKECGYLRGSQLFGQDGKAMNFTLKDEKWINNSLPSTPAETSKPTTGTPAPAENSGPAADEPQGPPVARIILPITGQATAASTGSSGTWAGTGTQPNAPATNEPEIKDGKKKEDEDDLGMMNGMAMPLMFGLMQMSGGEPNFMSSAIQGYMMGTQWAYSKQEEGEYSYDAVLKDLAYKSAKLLMPTPKLDEKNISQEESSGITMQELEEKSIEQREDNAALSMEKRKLAFLNEGGIVQEEPSKPIFRVLQIKGERIEYETKYEYDEEQKPTTIKVKTTKPYVENFMLQFNAFNPVTKPPEPWETPNCQLGAMSGITGEKAVPKVLLQWDWSSIKENTCDETNPNYVYCDATQFSIEILKKLEKVKTFIENNKPFDCPTGETTASVSEQQISETAKDIAITKIQAQKSGADANVIVTIESNNKKEMLGTLKIEAKDINAEGTGTIIAQKTVNFTLISKEIVSQALTGLKTGDYEITAAITTQLCEECENNDLGNDSITAKLNMTDYGVGKCIPYNTKRLKDFIEATEFNGHARWTQQQKDEILNAINFNALLIKDAYPQDFRNDFHEYCMHQSFFDCPDYYKKQQGLGEFFKSNENFKFEYGLSENAPLSAGKYNVVLNIEFENDNWNFFGDGKLGAVVKVEMTQLETPRPDNAFYYLPFDGKIGIGTENGRQGYGVNYRQESEETIYINNSSSQLVSTTNIPSSTPVYGAWLTGSKVQSFRTLNADKRGIIMEVKAGSDSTDLVLSPSFATPVIMKVDYSTGENAYGFYSVETGGSAESSVSKMIFWNGIGVGCKDFKDAGMSQWENTPDVHGGITGNVKCSIGTQITDYGVEWCNPTRQGTVALSGIIFTPQNSSSILKRKTYADNMQLIGILSSGTQIGLNGIPGQQFNSYGISTINSVEDVFKLVKEGKACVSGASNRAGSQFFWNPKPVTDALGDQIKALEKTCIQPK